MSTILDLENGRVISIDHDAKTYSIMTFAQMSQMMEQAVEQAKAEAARETGGGEVGRERPVEPVGQADHQPRVRLAPAIVAHQDLAAAEVLAP